MVTPTDSVPFFNHTKFQRECPNPSCDDEILFHYASLGNPPVGTGLKLHIVVKCINPKCGRVEHYEPPVDEETAHHLRTEWNGASYHPWNAHYVDEPIEELTAVFGQKVAEEIQERLDALGYF